MKSYLNLQIGDIIKFNFFLIEDSDLELEDMIDDFVTFFLAGKY